MKSHKLTAYRIFQLVYLERLFYFSIYNFNESQYVKRDNNIYKIYLT